MKTVASLPVFAGLAAAVKFPVEGPECKARPYNGPLVTNPDTPGAFKAYAPFNSAATVWAAEHNLPDDYITVPGFVNLNSAAQSPGYLSSIEPESYDPIECALYCDNDPTCTSFNIFYERVPLIVNTKTLSPDPEVCPGLSTSPSATIIKCAFYSTPLTASSATNNGQYQGEFEVVFAGSTAFFKWDAPAVHGFYGPFPLNGSITAPYGYLGHETFPDTDFDPEKCALSCDEHFDFDEVTRKVSNQCIFFNAYKLFKNGDEGVFQCAYYSEIWGPAEATNQGQVDGLGNVYSVGLSYAYYLEEQYYLPGTKDAEWKH
ncbi:hypothetical protein B0T16DRAFT_98231 [Cercophora newfieldiana]|uniref:Uncharacterized protein n=1 Tax=Cercophora newfieldiana TaxID=92897 RepID=A0AA40CUS4_9PEZI|nr:hypothetical protein B0T16DRAFT_98231 [Cercophora newfieldiana]